MLVLPQTGKATVEFQLSDDIARYQVLVAGHTADGRIDHRFNTDNSIFARVSYNNVDTVQPGGCPTPTTGHWNILDIYAPEKSLEHAATD